MVTLIRAGNTQAQHNSVAATHPSAFATTNAPLQSPARNAAPSEPAPGRVPVLSRVPVLRIERKVRRSISPISGMALEKLGHAIEYLTDEYAFESAVSGSTISGDPTLQAIQLLMSLNRQVYFECPVVEPLVQRILSRLFPEQPEHGRNTRPEPGA